MKKCVVSSSGSKVSSQKRLVTWFHGICPILLYHKWSSAETARHVEVMIDPMLQQRITLINQPAVQGEIDGAPGGGSINDTTWRGLISATFTDFTRCKQPYYYSFPDDDNLDLKGLCNGVNPIQ